MESQTGDAGMASGVDEDVRLQALVERQKAYIQQRDTEATWMAKSKIRSAGAMPFWIAGCTVFNLVAAFTGWSVEFPVGLLSPLYALGFSSAVFGKGSLAAQIAAIVASVVFVLPFVVFGYYGRQGKLWAFVGAVGLYALDTALLLLSPFPLWFVLHALFLWWMIMAIVEIRSTAKLSVRTEVQPATD